MFVNPRKECLSVIVTLTILLLIYTITVVHDLDQQKKLNDLAKLVVTEEKYLPIKNYQNKKSDIS